ncbi:MAG: ATP-binding protein [Cyanobacteria bacterium J06576_12]
MNQVFMNILANALDALEKTAEPTIEIVTQPVDRQGSPWIRIEIADNGAGIAEPTKEHLFEPLFTTKPVDKGTGLGLSISHEIVEKKHGGELTCESHLGEGCRFIIMLPTGEST